MPYVIYSLIQPVHESNELDAHSIISVMLLNRHKSREDVKNATYVCMEEMLIQLKMVG